MIEDQKKEVETMIGHLAAIENEIEKIMEIAENGQGTMTVEVGIGIRIGIMIVGTRGSEKENQIVPVVMIQGAVVGDGHLGTMIATGGMIVMIGTEWHLLLDGELEFSRLVYNGMVPCASTL